MDLTIPPENSHWSLGFVDIFKPFPNNTMANVTHKIIRFFYPPFALDAVDITHQVSDPQPSVMNMIVYMGFPLLMTSASYIAYKYIMKPKREVLPDSPEKLLELEQRMKAKYGSEYKLGIWERKDIPDPILASASASKDLSSLASNNAFIEGHWLPPSYDDLMNFDSAKEGDSKPNVTFNKVVKCRLFDSKTKMNVSGDGQAEDVVAPIQATSETDYSDPKGRGQEAGQET